jgi:hypothetical protein
MMCRFGFKAKKCKKPDTELDCLKKLYIDNQSVAIYTNKRSASAMWLFNLTNNQWYQMHFDEFKTL